VAQIKHADKVERGPDGRFRAKRGRKAKGKKSRKRREKKARG